MCAWASGSCTTTASRPKVPPRARISTASRRIRPRHLTTGALHGALVGPGRALGLATGQVQKLFESLSVKQGKKFDDPRSKDSILPFVRFHKLNVAEIAAPLESFKTFNEFFYRKLKPGARTVASPDAVRAGAWPAAVRGGGRGGRALIRRRTGAPDARHGVDAENQKVFLSPADARVVVFPTIAQASQLWYGAPPRSARFSRAERLMLGCGRCGGVHRWPVGRSAGSRATSFPSHICWMMLPWCVGIVVVGGVSSAFAPLTCPGGRPGLTAACRTFLQASEFEGGSLMIFRLVAAAV